MAPIDHPAQRLKELQALHHTATVHGAHTVAASIMKDIEEHKAKTAVHPIHQMSEQDIKQKQFKGAHPSEGRALSDKFSDDEIQAMVSHPDYHKFSSGFKTELMAAVDELDEKHGYAGRASWSENIKKLAAAKQGKGKRELKQHTETGPKGGRFYITTGGHKVYAKGK
jgi:hypothetical protein